MGSDVQENLPAKLAKIAPAASYWIRRNRVGKVVMTNKHLKNDLALIETKF